MNTAFAITLASFVFLQDPISAEPPRDVRMELPRDVRIMLLGVPSAENARKIEQELLQALADYKHELARPDASPTKLEQARMRICFRVGKLDEGLAALIRSMRDQERIQGLEEYRDLARALETQRESLRAFCGDSELPVVDAEGDDVAESRPADELRQLERELASINEVLARVDEKAEPDAIRKAELERSMGGFAQFFFQMKNLVDQAKATETGQAQLQIDTNDISRGVQGLVESIRDLRRERELREGRRVYRDYPERDYRRAPAPATRIEVRH